MDQRSCRKVWQCPKFRMCRSGGLGEQLGANLAPGTEKKSVVFVHSLGDLNFGKGRGCSEIEIEVSGTM